MDKRLYSTKGACEQLGIPVRVFLEMSHQPGFPKPVHGKKHHFWWDMKALQAYIDNINKSATNSAVSKGRKLFLERLRNNGGNQSEIPR